MHTAAANGGNTVPKDSKMARKVMSMTNTWLMLMKGSRGSRLGSPAAVRGSCSLGIVR